MKLGVIGGNGKWGSNYINLLKKLNINYVIGDRLDWVEVIRSHQCDGIIVSTPPGSHVKIALEALSKSLPVLIEKPLALTSKECYKLKAEAHKAPILVNHIHLFSPAFEKICQMLKPEDIINIRSVGSNKGPYRDYSPLFDYGPHDLAMGMYLLKSLDPTVEFVFATSPDQIGKQFEIKLNYPNASHRITIGNAAPQKNRFFEVLTNKNNIFTYNNLINNKLMYNNSPIEVDETSPLENVVSVFIKAINGYINDDRLGLDLSIKTVQILESL